MRDVDVTFTHVRKLYTNLLIEQTWVELQRQMTAGSHRLTGVVSAIRIQDGCIFACVDGSEICVYDTDDVNANTTIVLAERGCALRQRFCCRWH